MKTFAPMNKCLDFCVPLRFLCHTWSLCISRWKSFKLYHTGWKRPSPYYSLFYPILVGTRDLRTLWSPQISLNKERHTQRRKAAIFIFILFIFCDKNPLKSPPWKHTCWSEHFGKFPKKKLNRHISRREKKKFWNRNILRRKKTGFEIAEISGGFGQIPSFLLLKPVYEGCANPNPLTPKEDDRTNRHLKYYI
jgi:hypothetical protein